jgi:succinyl-diaminopimelate desuccinylase
MKAILAAVDELQDELVTLLQRLIRIPTVNPPGEAYEEFVADLRAVLDGYGYATEVHHAPTELAPLGEGRPRPNLIGKLAGDGPLVHLNGHYDVVPVGNDWTRDPFGGELADGHIYGRGSADMKSGLAAQIIAVEALRATGIRPNIHQSAVPDEETVGVRNAGMGWLVEQGLLEGDAVIITEPFGPDGVGIGHKGAIWGEITIFGKQAHGSAPQLGVNAVELMARYLATLDRELRPQLETRITDYGVTPDNQRSTLSFDTAATPPTSSPTAARSRSTAG